MDKQNIQKLIEKALEQLSFSYAPYSHYHVGAALLTAQDEIYTGCNIENAAYGECICAERTAIFKAVSEGKRDLRGICIVGGTNGDVTDFAPPCGACRQVMAEFADPDEFFIVLAVSTECYKIYKLRELLPEGFGKGYLQEGIYRNEEKNYRVSH